MDATTHRAVPRRNGALGWKLLLAVSVALLAPHTATAGRNVWTPIGPYPADRTRVDSILILPGSPSTMFVGKARDVGYPGLFETTDRGNVWTSLGDPGLLGPIFDLAVDPTNRDVMYAGLFQPPPALHKSIDGGVSWAPSSQGLDDNVVNSIAVDPVVPTTLYAATSYHGLYKSTDGATSWRPMGNGAPSSGAQFIVIDHRQPNVVYAAFRSRGALYKSEDHGESWRSLFPGPPYASEIVNSIAIDPVTSSTLYAVIEAHGIFKSTDAGDSWELVHPETSLRLTDVKIDPTDPERVYVVVVGEGVLRSKDAGTSWDLLSDGVPDSSISSFAIDPIDPAILYIGFWNGLVYQLEQVGPSVCGNGAIESPETCDPGVDVPGDCCSATCTIETPSTVCRPAADTFAPASTTCRLAAGDCDVSEACTGSSAECPTDGHAAAGQPCMPDTEACTTDSCDGAGACVHQAGNRGIVCRDSIGACDRSETCDGTSSTCPADLVREATAVCRASAGECDPSEFCTGSSGSCPTDRRSVRGLPCTADTETCTTDVCDGVSVVCQHPPGNVGAVCRPSAGDCDVVEQCDGLGSACPADTGLPDRDGDGTCDARDPCTNVGGAQSFVSPPRSVVKLTNVNTNLQPGDDRLSLTGFFDLPVDREFSDLRLDVTGARVLIEGDDGRPTLDVMLPAGGYSPTTRSGWRRNRRSWTFLDRSSTPLHGITKITVVDRARSSTPRQVKVIVGGKKGDYPVGRGSSPLRAIVALGGAADAAAGVCGESAYTGSDCASNRRGDRLTCTR